MKHIYNPPPIAIGSVQRRGIKIIFFGSPDYAQSTLTALKKNFNVVAVVTQEDKPQGRNKEMVQTPIKKTALDCGIPAIDMKDTDLLAQEIKKYSPDMGVVFSFGKILPQKILELFPMGILNIHPSLLPKYRGPSPVQGAILNGDEVSGVSIMLLDEKMDSGPIFAQKKIKIQNNEMAESLLRRLSEEGAKLLIKTIPQYISQKIIPTKQKHENATYTKIIKKEVGEIRWSDPAKKIYLQYRALAPWPGLYTYWNGRRLKFISLGDIIETNEKIDAVGKVFSLKNKIFIQCGAGAISPAYLQLEGKKALTIDEFFRGNKSLLGSTLGKT